MRYVLTILLVIAGTLASASAAVSVIDRTHSLCPYPQVAVYKGMGSIDVAENFICKAR